MIEQGCRVCGRPTRTNWSYCSSTCQVKVWRAGMDDEARERIRASKRAAYRRDNPLPTIDSLPGEAWLQVAGYEGIYEVSNKGRIKSFARGSEKLLRLVSSHEYLVVGLSRNGVTRLTYVHRIVLEAFVGPCPPGRQGCHQDGNPHNNTPENLYWGTPSDNMQDRLRHGRDPQSNKTHCSAGHPYDTDNTYVDKRGHRFCRACGRIRSSKYKTRSLL